MFRSRTRPIITPQWEHARLSAVVASLWGNDDFDQPPLPNDSFVLGVAYHDREYGFIDNDPIPGVAPDRWLELKEQHLDWRLDDPVAEIVGLLHVRRLLEGADHPQADMIRGRFDEAITRRLDDTEWPRDAFAWTDRIVDLCDMIAFDFGLDAPVERTKQIAPRHDDPDALVEVRYQLHADSSITIDPWPLSQPQYTGVIYAYQAEGYPDRLQPVRRAYTLRRA